MSDIHGQKESFQQMLQEIKFKKSDHLYIIGDLIDRGPDGIELLKQIRKTKNITLIKGNHESMMLESLDIGNKLKADKDKEGLDKAVEIYKDWLNHGGEPTLEQYRLQTKSMQKNLLEFLQNIPEYKIINVNNQWYLLIHAGLFIPRANLELKSLINANIEAQELHLYVREEFWNSPIYLEDGMKMIVGHTSTRYIPDIKSTISKDNKKRCKENRIYMDPNVIGIDCGAHLKTGKLACLRLDDMKEFYIKKV